jgi:hypothetical protein
VPSTSSKLQRQGFTQALEVVYRVLCFMGNEAKHGELSIPLEKGAVVTGIGESSMKKLNQNETAEVARRPVKLRTVHSTKHVSLKDFLLVEFSISICFSVD